MKNLYLLFFILLLSSCNDSSKNPEEKNKSSTSQEVVEQTFGIVIHGGAGTILKKNMTDSLENAYKEVLTKAISKGHEILKNGGSSLEAVQRTINIMENSPSLIRVKGQSLIMMA